MRFADSREGAFRLRTSGVLLRLPFRDRACNKHAGAAFGSLYSVFGTPCNGYHSKCKPCSPLTFNCIRGCTTSFSDRKRRAPRPFVFASHE